MDYAKPTCSGMSHFININQFRVRIRGIGDYGVGPSQPLDIYETFSHRILLFGANTPEGSRLQN